MYLAAGIGAPPAQRMMIEEMRIVTRPAMPISNGPRHQGVEARSANLAFISRFPPSIRQLIRATPENDPQFRSLSLDTSRRFCRQVLKFHPDLR